MVHREATSFCHFWHLDSIDHSLKHPDLEIWQACVDNDDNDATNYFTACTCAPCNAKATQCNALCSVVLWIGLKSSKDLWCAFTNMPIEKQISPSLAFSHWNFQLIFACVCGIRSHQKQFQRLLISNFSWNSMPPDPLVWLCTVCNNCSLSDKIFRVKS